MERDLTGYTKSSTSESLSSCGDLSLEDHGSLSSASRVSLETSISYLTKHQNFIYFNSKEVIDDIGQQGRMQNIQCSYCILSFSEFCYKI